LYLLTSCSVHFCTSIIARSVHFCVCMVLISHTVYPRKMLISSRVLCTFCIILNLADAKYHSLLYGAYLMYCVLFSSLAHFLFYGANLMHCVLFLQSWSKQPGELVKRDDTLGVVETDKVVFMVIVFVFIIINVIIIIIIIVFIIILIIILLLLLLLLLFSIIICFVC
jgi:hypothetical protein